MDLERDYKDLHWRIRSPKRVKALAYAYASEGKHSPEIAKLRTIERFGLEAVTGRKVLLYNEYLRMVAAENVVTAYNSRKPYQDWAMWATDEPHLSKILNEAIKLYAAGN